MKVLLVNPYSQDQALSNKWKDFGSITVPLGLGYIAAHLRSFDVAVEILDCFAEKISLDMTVKRMIISKPDIIGISCSTPSFGVVKEIAESFKKKMESVPVVVGGCHPTVFPEETLQFSCFDYVVRGEGEFTLLDLIRHLKGQTDIGSISGLSYRKKGNIKHNPERGPIADLDSLAYPAVDILNLNLYRDPPHWEIRKPALNILGSRGCIFNCSFCSHKFMFKGRRRRSAKNIVREIKYLVEKYKVKQINFQDAIFPANENEGQELCQAILAEGLEKEIVWLCETNVKVVTPSLLRNMKKSSCRKIILGIESGNERILKEIGKGYDRDDIRNCVKMIADVGIEAIGMFIFGFPGETKEEIEETIKFSLSLRLRYARYNLLVPYPGTRIYNFIKDYNRDLLPGSWDSYIPYPFVANHKQTYTPDKIDTDQLNLLLRRAHLRFYIRPMILLSELGKPNIRETLRRIAVGLFQTHPFSKT